MSLTATFERSDGKSRARRQRRNLYGTRGPKTPAQERARVLETQDEICIAVHFKRPQDEIDDLLYRLAMLTARKRGQQ